MVCETVVTKGSGSIQKPAARTLLDSKCIAKEELLWKAGVLRAGSKATAAWPKVMSEKETAWPTAKAEILRVGIKSYYQ